MPVPSIQPLFAFRRTTTRGTAPSPPGTRLLHMPCGVTLLVDRRNVAANALLTLLLATASLLSLCLGTATLTPGEVTRALLGDAEPMTRFVVTALRGPRLAAGLLTGAAFSLAGCLMQTLARNRLATPGIIGIDNGATAFAVASVLGVGLAAAPPAMALVGSATAAAVR